MQIKREEILVKLKEIVDTSDKNGALESTEILEDMQLVRDLGFDSMRMLYMAVLIEETFEIKLKNIKGQNLQTMGDVVDMIEKRINNETKGEKTL